ncbi:thioredoxin reductase [Tamaricihabitans halophyticus]|uniref:Thioredoxin reductase n=1 Tax=Tamaricihabitans halophyticus TaxID=1262583 RepID=A0A4R2QGW1_9PSEU|nr:FAD-dependent oxidoreductase [Tamaricihabitans halophyticus]TCP48470.1 thioredoxin reductase [Tamaricihabitans halophyticus]
MTAARARLEPDVAIVGGGPAGLRAARELAPAVSGAVLVLDRESRAGGIPRHCAHTGFGIRDERRMFGGPAYATRMVRAAERAGAVLRSSAMVTGWSATGGLEVTSPDGLFEVHARAVVVATGARERPRSARMIPGDRADGVYTTGYLQNMVHLQERAVGRRAVIVGSELVSWSAVLTLRHAGCETVLMTSEQPRVEAYSLFSLPGKHLLRVPVRTSTRVTRIIGSPRVRAVEIEESPSGNRTTIPCDTVVLTGDWIPDNELFRSAGIALDPATRGPVVDTELRTDRPGLFAAGNVLHPVDTADIAALDGVQVAAGVLDYLAEQRRDGQHVRITADQPLRWIAPMIQRVGARPPARKRLLAWVDGYVPFPKVVARQGGRVIAQRRLPWPAVPGRVFRIPSEMLSGARPDGGEVRISLG